MAWAGGSHGRELSFARSTDGGQSFEAPRTIIPLHAEAEELAGGAHGLVCAVAERHARQEASGDLQAQVVAVCSTDGGNSFGAPVPLGTDSPFFNLPGGVLPNSGPTVAAAPRDNALYVAFTTHRPGAVHSDIMVTASHDRDRTWSQPAAATPHDSVAYFQPNPGGRSRTPDRDLRICPGEGPHRPGPIRLRAAEAQLRPTAQGDHHPFNPHTATASGGKHGAWWVGDYQAIAASSGGFQLVWNDARTGKLELTAATVHP